MSDDRELLALAAKAYADPHIKADCPEFTRWIGRNEDMGCDVMVRWNPLTDDGDALRLAVKLNMQIWHRSTGVQGMATGLSFWDTSLVEPLDSDPYAATRRAIVRAAAAIARQEGKTP